MFFNDILIIVLMSSMTGLVMNQFKEYFYNLLPDLITSGKGTPAMASARKPFTSASTARLSAAR